MNERIKELRNHLGLSQSAFGDRIGVTRGAICLLEKGTNDAAPQTIKSICREFSVSEYWLRTGNGSMFIDLSRSELAARIVGNALATEDEFVLNTFISLGQLSPQEWQLIKGFVEKIKGS